MSARSYVLIPKRISLVIAMLMQSFPITHFKTENCATDDNKVLLNENIFKILLNHARDHDNHDEYITTSFSHTLECSSMLPASWAALFSQRENGGWYVPADESSSNSSPSDTARVGFLTFLFLLILPAAAQAAQVDGQTQQVHTEPSCCYTAQEDERLKHTNTWDISFFVKKNTNKIN